MAGAALPDVRCVAALYKVAVRLACAVDNGFNELPTATGIPLRAEWLNDGTDCPG